MRVKPWLTGRGFWPARRPQYVSIDVCDRCNLRCVTCAAWRKRPESGLLEPGRFRRILRNLAGLQGSEVDLIGAEPTLHPALPELTAAAAEAGFRPRLFTNGVRVDAPLAERLASSGLTQVTVSLDGASPATHDRLRGVEGAHARALDAVGHFAAAGAARELEIATFTVVSRANFRELSEIVLLARERGATRSAFHLVSQVPETACRAEGASAQYAAARPALLLGTQDLADFRASVERAFGESDAPSLALLRALGPKTLREGRFPFRTCRFARISLNVSTDGHVYPCSHFCDVRWGSLAERHWRALWHAPQRQAFLRQVDRGRFEACAHCCHYVHNLTLAQLARVALGLPLGDLGDAQ